MLYFYNVKDALLIYLTKYEFDEFRKLEEFDLLINKVDEFFQKPQFSI